MYLDVRGTFAPFEKVDAEQEASKAKKEDRLLMSIRFRDVAKALSTSDYPCLRILEEKKKDPLNCPQDKVLKNKLFNLYF